MTDDRAYTRLAREAARLFGTQVKIARKERGVTQAELAARAGMSRSSLVKIERGDLGVELGLAFEAAAVVGVPLFGEEDAATLALEHVRLDRHLTLLPQSVRRSKDVDDDF